MSTVERSRLITILQEHDGQEATEAANHLRAGAEFVVLDLGSATGETLASVYRVRAEHVRRGGVDVRGLDEAAERFEVADEVDTVVTVHGDTRGYWIYLTRNAERIVACISVPASAST
jgi:hypothetical protein